MTKAYQNLFEILWYSQLPCFDVKGITSVEKDQLSMIKRCYWRGEPMECSAIFKTTPTDRGMCCSFNMESAESLYRDGKYVQTLQKLQTKDKLLAFPSNDERTELKDPKPQAGIKRGLMLILDAHTNLLASGSVSDELRGFFAIVNSRNGYPMTITDALLIKPGVGNNVGISAVNVEADNGIRAIAPEVRKCYFSDEKSLSIHKVYSQSNCYFECNLNFARKNIALAGANFTECVPWFYPVEDKLNVRMCSPWEQKAFQDLMGTAPPGSCKDCLPDCNDNIFETHTSAAQLKRCDHTNFGSSVFCDLVRDDLNPSMWSQDARIEFSAKTGNVPEYLMKGTDNSTKFSNRRYHVPDAKKVESLVFQEKVLEDPTYDAFENDIAMVNFYFEKDRVFQFKRKQPFTWFNFVAQAGGMFGFGFGFSLISAAEIVYWVTVRFLQNVWASKGKRGTQKIISGTTRPEKIRPITYQEDIPVES